MSSPATIEENKRTVRRFPEEVVNERNLDAIDELFAEDAVDHTPFGESRGHAEIREQFEMILGALPDVTVTVEDVVAEGDTVALRLTQRGTHEGELMGIEPTGQEFELHTMAFARLEDGKIVERWIQSDMLGLMQQLGVVEPPGE